MESENPYRPPEPIRGERTGMETAPELAKKPNRVWMVLGSLSFLLIGLSAITAPIGLLNELVSLGLFSLGLVVGVAAAFSHGNQHANQPK